LGALATSLGTFSGVSILNVGAPFWGLVFGVATSWLTERAALREVWPWLALRDGAAYNHSVPGGPP
jgi:hypothetical protein